MICDDDRLKVEITNWFASWNRALSTTSDAANTEKLAVLETMHPKTFALRLKMSGKTPLAFTLCQEGARHRLEVVRNILSTLAKYDLQCIYNVRLKQVDVLQNILIEPEYRDTCPANDGYYEEYDGNSWANVSISTFNSFSNRTKDLEDSLARATAALTTKDQEIAFLQREIERLRTLGASALPIPRLPGSPVQISLPIASNIRIHTPMASMKPDDPNSMHISLPVDHLVNYDEGSISDVLESPSFHDEEPSYSSVM